jgi:hypothetical protein
MIDENFDQDLANLHRNDIVDIEIYGTIMRMNFMVNQNIVIPVRYIDAGDINMILTMSENMIVEIYKPEQ